jgi:diguanylate cyclase (GGDEF)-like protein
MRSRGPRPTDGWSVRAQLAAIVLVVATLIVSVGAVLAHLSSRDAVEQARRGATFQASLAATAITDALTQAETAMAGLANGFPVPTLLKNPSACSLSFTDLGVFSSGHIDIVLSDGRVPCSSSAKKGAPPGATHAGAAWLTEAGTTRAPRVTGVFTDQLTRQQAVAVTAPISAPTGKLLGFTALVLPIADLSAGLAKTYGGPEKFAFTVRDSNRRLLASPAAARGGVAADTITGTHEVPQLGWQISAARLRADALASTRTAFTRLAVLAAAALALLLALLAAAHGRIGRPLRRLTVATAHASVRGFAEQVAERGPTEVRRLAREFNAMISARAGYEAQLNHHALHDPLTGLPNRALCLDRITHALEGAGADPGEVAVLVIDLDRFKFVNASLGYQVGDQVLIAAGTRLASVLRPGDTLARSGDGFIICRPSADEAVAGQLAAQLIASLSEDFAAAGVQVSLTASLGVAFGRRGATADELVRDAGTAMYEAKGAGGGRFRLINDELRQRTGEQLSLEADLRTALANGQLHVEYQPLVNLVTGQALGTEALLRWTHPNRGPISPLVFIPLAERTGLIVALGQFVLEQASAQAAAWHRAGHSLRMSVNMSGLQLHAPGFVESVATVLHDTGLDPAQLCLELTETVLMDDALRGAEVLRDLKGLGVTLSVDDFGTGYSSLAYLQQFPVDELKIDRCFVQRLGDSGNDHSLVAAMVAMGHALGLHVLAEGVETDQQRAALLTLGCRSAQGFLFSKPQRPAQVADWLRRRTSHSHDVGPATRF